MVEMLKKMSVKVRRKKGLHRLEAKKIPESEKNFEKKKRGHVNCLLVTNENDETDSDSDFFFGDLSMNEQSEGEFKTKEHNNSNYCEVRGKEKQERIRTVDSIAKNPSHHQGFEGTSQQQRCGLAKTTNTTDPTLKEIKLLKIDRCTSTPALSHSVGTRGKSSMKDLSLAANPNRVKRNVSFHRIDVREYSQTLGDHPSCTYGPPVSLDWHYSNTSNICVESYEKNRPARRVKSEMLLDFYAREAILHEFTAKQLLNAANDVQKVKDQRSSSKTMGSMYLSITGLEDAVDDAFRGFNNISSAVANGMCHHNTFA